MEGVSNPFDPPAYVRQIEEAARTGDWTLQYLSPCASGTRPWLQRVALTTRQAPTLYLSAGIHGDEISGPWAVLDMLRQPDFFTGFHTTIFPILNPDGLARDLRTNTAGIDLNRDYRNPKSAEIASHIAALQTLGRFDATLMLHEDYEGIGAYLYELNTSLPATLGPEIMAAMGRHVPIDLRPEIEEVRAIGGIIQRQDLLDKFGRIEERPEWPEAIYLSVHHTEVSYTTETPKPFPLADRVQAQIAAVSTVMRALERKLAGESLSYHVGPV